jgi:glycosyltransferase involved in cell wall biosynthesis
VTDARSDTLSPVEGTSIAVVNWRDPWHPQAGGAELYAWEMARGLVRRGARVRYLTARARGQARQENRDGIEVIRMGGRFGVYPRVLAWLAPRRRRFDAVIDCQNGIPFFTPWVLSRRVPVLCVVHHVHDAQFGVHFPAPVAAIGRLLEGPVARWTYRRHECVAISDSTVGAMRRRLGWTGAIHIVPVGLSPDCFEAPTPGSPPTAEGAAVGGPALSWVGRLVAHKRADRILDVADRLRAAGVTVQVIGRGPLAGPLAAQVASRGLDGVVRLRGYLPEEEKRAAVATSLLHLNTSQGEGWGMCVIEAAALGVPTVAYDVDGLRDAVRHGETGWLVHDGERIEDVTQRAVKELADPVRRAEVTAACRAWAASFDWDQSAGQLARLVGAAVRRKAR